MFIGIRQLRRTRDLLGFNGRPSDRDLSEAMLSFWAACELRHDWPSGFAARAEEIRLLTAANGSIDATVAGMTDAQFAELRDRLRRFVDDAERHMAEHPARA